MATPILPHQDQLSNKSGRNRVNSGSSISTNEGSSHRVTRGPKKARNLDTWTMVFEGVNSDICDEIMDFLDDVGNYDTFSAKMPTDFEEKIWVLISEVQHSTRGPDFHTIQFTATQEIIS